MSNEIKIGILAVVAIIIGIVGVKFMKGQNIFSNDTTIYVKYSQIDQLSSSSPVFMNGFPIGGVADVRLNPEDMNSVLVTLHIKNEVRIHKDALAEIGSSIMGGSYVTIGHNKNCTGADCVQDEGSLKGTTLGILGSMLPKDDVNEYTAALRQNLGGMMDTINTKINDPDPNNKIGQSIRDLAITLENLKVSTQQLESIMRNNAQNLNTTMSNMAKLTNTLANNNDKITGILASTDNFTKDLSQLNLSNTMSKADTTLESANEAVRQLQTTLATSDKMVTNLNEMVNKMKNGEGTIGLMLNDDQLYKNLNQTSETLSKVLTDFQEKPYRYMPLKSRRKVLKHDEKDAEAEAEAAAQENNN